MTIIECDREADVLEAAFSGNWTDDVSSHARGCPVCRDLATVAIPLRQDHHDVSSEARVPTAGQVWWRATMRRRAEAAAAAARPITMVQGIAGACAAGFCAALITLAWPSVTSPAASLVAAVTQEGSRIDAAAFAQMAASPALVSLVFLGGAGLILASLIVYVAWSDE